MYVHMYKENTHMFAQDLLKHECHKTSSDPQHLETQVLPTKFTIPTSDFVCFVLVKHSFSCFYFSCTLTSVLYTTNSRRIKSHTLAL